MSDFKPQKLSQQSLDAFVRKHGTITPTDSSPFCIKYTTESGEELYLDTKQLRLNDKMTEFAYFLGQTVPAHTKKMHPLRDIAFIQKVDGTKEPWTTKNQVLRDFTKIATACTYVNMEMGNDYPVIWVLPFIAPIIHGGQS